MKDVDCVSFLQWCLPRLNMRWEGFRKVRTQVCKRIGRRIETLGLSGPEATSRGHRNGLHILATDVDEHMIERARIGCYQRVTLKELPDRLVEAAFDVDDSRREPYCLKEAYREGVTFRRHDVRDAPPEGPFDLILCRNLVFMYFDEELQRECLERFGSVLRRGGALVIGKHEALPESDSFEPWFPDEGIFRK